MLDAITHHHSWEQIPRHVNPPSPYPPALVSRHLEPEPVIVPPVLSKSGLVAQPVLRLVWTLAFKSLSTANKVTFIGYSFPPTDTASRVLFSEALRDLPADDIAVVGMAAKGPDRDDLKTRYCSVLGNIPDDRFFFDGAVDWVRELANRQQDDETSPPTV